MSEANSKLSPEQEKELLEKYAPVMRFSAGERFFPTKVNDYVNNCHALVDGKTQDWIEGPEIKDLVEKDDPESYLWFVEPSPFDRKFRLWKQRVSQRLPRIDKRTLKLFLIISGAFVLCILLVLSLPNLITARNDVATFAIAIDGDGHKWVGTDGGRVSEFDGTKWTTYTTTHGLTYNTVYTVSAIAIDGDGHKWFGTLGGGVSEFDGTAGDGTWTTHTTVDRLASNYVLAIAIDGDGHKWVGTWGGGASEFDGTKWTTYTTADGLAHNTVYAVAIDGDGHKWFGTLSGVSEFDGTKWTTYTTTHGLAHNTVSAIAIDGDRHKWFGTWGGGVSEFDGTKWTTYTTTHGLAHNTVSAIVIDGDGHKWFGTWGGGVSEFDGTAGDGTWTTHTTVDGLASNYVRSIAIDGDGYKWVGTSSGVSELPERSVLRTVLQFITRIAACIHRRIALFLLIVLLTIVFVWRVVPIIRQGSTLKSVLETILVWLVFSYIGWAFLELVTAAVVALIPAVFYFVLSADIAGAAVQLKSGKPLAWAEDAHRRYRTKIVNASGHPCTYYGRVWGCKNWTVLQYFYFYPFNDWRRYGGMNLHEGDWESVSVYVPGNPPQDGTQPYGVAYSQHHGKEFLLWEHTSHFAMNNEFHPVVYVALGSHANYPFADNRIDASEMERFGLLQEAVSKIELQARRIGLLGGRLPADVADGLGLQLNPIKGDPKLEYIELADYFKAIEELDKDSANRGEKDRRQRISKLWWTGEEAKRLKGDLERIPISDNTPGWVDFQGLWGDRTGVPDESGPSGPRWDKLNDGEVGERLSWKDPLGWLEERKTGASESKGYETLKKRVGETWPELTDSPAHAIQSGQYTCRLIERPGARGHNYSPERFDELLDDGRSLFIVGESRDVNWAVLQQLAKLQMKRVEDARDDLIPKRMPIPVILPLSKLPEIPDNGEPAQGERHPVRPLSKPPKVPDAGEPTQDKGQQVEQVAELMEWMAAELSALYGLPASKFYEWISEERFGETRGDEAGVLLFIELNAQGLGQWLEAFKDLLTYRGAIIALNGNDGNSLEHSDLLFEHSCLLEASPLHEQEKPPVTCLEQQDQLCEWLSWLARKMKGQRLFQVDRMQPGWLDNGWRKFYYIVEGFILFVMVTALTWGVVVASLPVFYTSGVPGAFPLHRWPFGPLFGGATGITVWFFAHRSFEKRWVKIVAPAIIFMAYTLALAVSIDAIESAGYIKPNAIPNPLFGALFGGLVAVGYLFYSLVRSRRSAQTWSTIETYEVRDPSWRISLQGAAYGVIFSMAIWVLVSTEGFSFLRRPQIQTQLHAFKFVYGSVGITLYAAWLFGKGHGKPSLEESIEPDKRIATAGEHALLTGVVGAFLMGVPFAFIRLDFGLWLGAVAGVFAAVQSGGLTWLQHHVLRFFLRVSGRVPGRLNQLLQKAQDCKSLVQRGGAYEFKTSSLMDHFENLP